MQRLALSLIGLLAAAPALAAKYDYKFTKGADTPKQACVRVVQALKADDAAAYADLTPNNDMKAWATVQELKKGQEDAGAAGDAKTAKALASMLKSLESPKAVKDLHKRRSAHPAEAKKELLRVKQALSEGVDLATVNLAEDQIELKTLAAGRTAC